MMFILEVFTFYEQSVTCTYDIKWMEFDSSKDKEPDDGLKNGFGHAHKRSGEGRADGCTQEL